MSLCPCGSGRELDACCGPLLGGAPAPTAEALMRSRYTAYATGDFDYLTRTLAPSAVDDFDPEEARANSEGVQWTGLTVRDKAEGGPDDAEGMVEYVANFRYQGKAMHHHERATFVRNEAGNWVFLDGEMDPKPAPRKVEKVGRNDPCPCGSGKKYKKCCGA